MTVLEVMAYLGYLIPTMVLFLRPASPKRSSAGRVESHATVATAATSTAAEPAR